MKSITSDVNKVLTTKPVRDSKKFEHQQSYYKRLSKKGVAKKETYNLQATQF